VIELFPFAEYWWFYLAFTGFVLLLLALDLGVFHRKAHEVSFREAATWSVVWVALALLFNFLLYQYALWKFPQYHWVVVLFGAFLILTGLKMMFASEKPVEPEKNLLIRLFRRFVPVTHELHGQNFFVRALGRIHATPLFIALLFLEATDIIFAVDSVPAIFALTSEPLIVFTSNIFAILGLRALYFMLAGAVDKFHLLKYGLAVVLVFVGLKMVWLNSLFGGKFPISLSLGVIGGVIAASVALSLLFPKAHEEPREIVG
jgi:tellurite resistance protein TerC